MSAKKKRAKRVRKTPMVKRTGFALAMGTAACSGSDAEPTPPPVSDMVVPPLIERSMRMKTVTVGGTDYDALEVLDIEWIQEDCEGDFEESEVTLDWYAQDSFGNIWYLGELSRSFEDECEAGEFDRTTPTNTTDEC